MENGYGVPLAPARPRRAPPRRRAAGSSVNALYGATTMLRTATNIIYYQAQYNYLNLLEAILIIYFVYVFISFHVVYLRV